MAIEVDYWFPAEVDAQKQAEIIAVGQTVSAWDSNFSHRETSLNQHLAKVISIQPSGDNSHLVTIAFPESNVEGDIPSLLTMIFGKYSMAGAAKVMEVRLPENYGLKPKFGIPGIRDILGVYKRPLIMATFKPALGLSAKDHGDILRQVAQAGLDIIQDDEIMGDLQSAPTLDRLWACREAVEEIKRKQGKKILYAVNVTGHGSRLQERARNLVRAGANALLFNVFSYGISVLEALAADPQIDVPIFVHPAGAGVLAGAPHHGFAYSVILGTFMAHAGTDAVLYPAHYGNLPFYATESTKIRNFLRQRSIFPVLSAGIHPGVVPQAIEDYGDDVILNAGTGIMDHPDGKGAGVKAFFEALSFVKNGRTFNLNMLPSGALRSAIAKWGIYQAK